MNDEFDRLNWIRAIKWAIGLAAIIGMLSFHISGVGKP